MKLTIAFAAVCASIVTALGATMDTYVDGLGKRKPYTACGKTLNEYFCLMRRQVLPGCSTGSIISNPVIFTVNPNVTVLIEATVNATDIQQLTVVPGLPRSTATVFQGSGVNGIGMPIVSGGNGTGLTLAQSATAYSLTLIFAFSSTGGRNFSVPTIFCPDNVASGPFTLSTVNTQDDALNNNRNSTTAQVLFVS